MGALKASRYENRPTRLSVCCQRETGITGLSLAHTILEEYFEHTIRWKDGPDGTLGLHLGRAGFYQTPRFVHHSVTVGCLEYACSLHFLTAVRRTG